MCSYNINAFRNKAANKSSAGECVPSSDTDVLFSHAKIIKGLKPPEIDILHQNDAEMVLITPFTCRFYRTKSFSAVSLSATVAHKSLNRAYSHPPFERSAKLAAFHLLGGREGNEMERALTL